MKLGRIVGESQNFTRDLVNEPGNKMTPTILGERAKKMCAENSLKCEVYGKDKLLELKMGSFWSVSQGSAEPPARIGRSQVDGVDKRCGLRLELRDGGFLMFRISGTEPIVRVYGEAGDAQRLEQRLREAARLLARAGR